MTTLSSLSGVSEVRLTSHPDRYPVGLFLLFCNAGARAHSLIHTSQMPYHRAPPSPRSYSTCWIHKRWSKDDKKFPFILTDNLIFICKWDKNRTKMITNTHFADAIFILSCSILFSCHVTSKSSELRRHQVCWRLGLLHRAESEQRESKISATRISCGAS